VSEAALAALAHLAWRACSLATTLALRVRAAEEERTRAALEGRDVSARCIFISWRNFFLRVNLVSGKIPHCVYPSLTLSLQPVDGAETPREDPSFLAMAHGIALPDGDPRVPRVAGAEAWLPDEREPVAVRHYARAIEILESAETDTPGGVAASDGPDRDS
jgi:hypothetical protein